MTELGMTPAARSRVAAWPVAQDVPEAIKIEFVTIYEAEPGEATALADHTRSSGERGGP